MLNDARLKAFAAVATYGSFTLAARGLGISQAAVSQRVAELEKEVGTLLFVRTRGAVTLTPGGETFRLYADRILRAYDAAARMFSAAEDAFPRRRPVIISADALVRERLLPPVLAALHGAVPQVSFRLSGPEEEGCDVRIFSRGARGGISLEESASLCLSVQACAVMRSGDGKSAGSDVLPAGTDLAVWAPYLPQLSPDFRSRVVLTSGSIAAILSTVALSPSLAGIVPSVPSCPTDARLRLCRHAFPELRRDIHFVPSDAFSTHSVCALLRETVRSLEAE